MEASECRQKLSVQQWRKLQRSSSNILSQKRFLPELMARNLCAVLCHLHCTDFLLSACGENKFFKVGFPTSFYKGLWGLFRKTEPVEWVSLPWCCFLISLDFLRINVQRLCLFFNLYTVQPKINMLSLVQGLDNCWDVKVYNCIRRNCSCEVVLY